MKIIKLFIIILISCFCSTSLKSQDECPSFKMGKKSIKLKFIPKMKKNQAIIKFETLTMFSVFKAFGREQGYTKQNGQTTSSYNRDYGNPNMNSYLGYIIPLSYETKISKKSTLKFMAGFEQVYRYSFPDTFLYNYPTVDMAQFISLDTLANSSNAGFSSGETSPYDITISNNFRTGFQYRYYPFTKAYKGFYVAPDFAVSVGKNKYIDLDTSLNNINYDYKQMNTVFTGALMIGSQFIIKKHFAIDLTTGFAFKYGVSYKRDYVNAEANDAGLRYKYPNTEAFRNFYGRTALVLGISIGYKF